MYEILEEFWSISACVSRKSKYILICPASNKNSMKIKIIRFIYFKVWAPNALRTPLARKLQEVKTKLENTSRK